MSVPDLIYILEVLRAPTSVRHSVHEAIRSTPANALKDIPKSAILLAQTINAPPGLATHD